MKLGMDLFLMQQAQLQQVEQDLQELNGILGMVLKELIMEVLK
jgi:hypothetical protein